MRLPLVLATIAALMGAPSSASAAGNELASPSATPTSGTVTTVFTLDVTYDGLFPATVVTVSVAGLSLPMALISGTALQGTWSVSTLLPAGSWTPTFASTSELGNAATVAGPLISVSGPVTDPTPAPTVSGPSPRNGEIDTEGPGGSVDPGDPADPGAAPTEQETEAEPSAAADPLASTAAGPSAGDGGGGGTSAPAGPSGPASSPGAAGDDGGGGGEQAPAEAAEAPESDEPVAMPGSGAVANEEPAVVFVDDGLLNAVLLIGLSGVAAVAVIGTALLILTRRRTDENEAPVAVTERTKTDALLERRTLRQAHVRLPADPIVTAMGVDDQVAARRQRRRASQVGSGSGERPTRGRH